jgi:group I intron endonuclease
MNCWKSKYVGCSNGDEIAERVQFPHPTHTRQSAAKTKVHFSKVQRLPEQYSLLNNRNKRPTICENLLLGFFCCIFVSMRYDKLLKNKSGIYMILCIPTGKYYIGKSVNLYTRLKSHTALLNNQSKDENPYLLNAWLKYGEEKFEYKVIEFCEREELKTKELYYIEKLDSINPIKGFNLRLDTSSGMIPSEETRRKLSIATRNRYKDPTQREINRQNGIEKWKKLSWEEKDEIMSKVANTRSRYVYVQEDLNSNMIKEWSNIREILKSNSTYKRNGIYKCIYNVSPSYKGFKWTRKLKI